MYKLINISVVTGSHMTAPLKVCGQLWQNLVCMRATLNSIHRLKNE